MNRSFLSALALAVVASTANAQNIVTNGSFEQPVLNAGTNFATYGAGNGITGWTIQSGSIDLIRDYWQASNGLQSLDMNGNSPAVLSQMLTTNIGSTYNFSFFLAGNPDGRFDKGLNVFWNGTLLGGNAVTFTQGNHYHGSMGWTQIAFSGLAATSGQTEIRFQGLDTGTPQDHAMHAYIGAALDDVSVTQATTATPEPATVALTATGLLGLVAIARRKRA
jgi:choice-of-anchor C domain-containing protein